MDNLTYELFTHVYMAIFSLATAISNYGLFLLINFGAITTICYSSWLVAKK